MSGGTYYLAQGFLHIIVVMVKVLLAGHIDGIFVRFIMGHSAAIVTDRHKVVTHFQQEIIEADMHTPCVCLRISSFHGIPILLQNGPVSLFVHMGKCRLVYIEQSAYLSVMYSLILFLLLIVQCEVGSPVDELFRIVPVDIFVPVIVQERHTLFMLTYRRAAGLGITEQGEQVRIASVPIGMQCHEQCIERAGRHAVRVQPRIPLSRSVEPVTIGLRSLSQSSGKQTDLPFLCIFLYFGFFFHTVYVLGLYATHDSLLLSVVVIVRGPLTELFASGEYGVCQRVER